MNDSYKIQSHTTSSTSTSCGQEYNGVAAIDTCSLQVCQTWLTLLIIVISSFILTRVCVVVLYSLCS